MKIIIISIFAISLLISCGDNKVTEPTPELSLDDLFFGTDSTLEVVTWNVEHFPKAGDKTLTYLKEVIQQIEVDIIALQEIQSADDFVQLEHDLPNYSGFRANTAYYDINLAYLYKTESVLQPDITKYLPKIIALFLVHH